MDSSSHTASPLPKKRKAQELEDEDDKLAVAPPKHLHASITWDVQAIDVAHHMFCTQFVTIMDTAIESRKWTVDIQKKCMKLMGELKLREHSSKAISNHKLAKGFEVDPSFIRVMMLKVLYPLEKIKKCDSLLLLVAPEYPGWNYFKDAYPPSNYPTSQPAERELENIIESVQGMDKLLKDIHSTAEETKNKLQDVATREHINLAEVDELQWICDEVDQIEVDRTLELEEIRGLLIDIKQRCELTARKLLNLEARIQATRENMWKE